MKVGDHFTSYNDLQSAINEYEKENRVQFWKRDSKTLENAKNHCPKIFEKANRDLKYYIIKYSCIHGGQKFRPNKNNKSIRKHEGTLKQNCPAEINVKISDDGKSLLIKSMNINHNHEIPTEEIFKHLPKQRRLSDEHKKCVLEMMKLKINKKLLQADLVEKTGNSILLRDISNIVKNSQGKDNLQEMISILKEKYHCLIDVQTEENTFQGIFFQEEMQKCFSLFPEILFLDGTYKLLNNRCPVYVMVVENSFGTTDIVGIAIITKEDSESLGWFLNIQRKKSKVAKYKSYNDR
ncbi:uncharacterized protein LOC108914561 [Anoplophora glabripennis]|uniref:uncharacterized protein LOC108914561 n=1 Tax=Anoplophora glabripennis TaxID=217634 RepID=UPI000C756E40|nr:uncharacterized protein LOC108914561 [Anoplophora glabripennis]